MNFKSFILVLLAAFSLASWAQAKKGKVGDGGGNGLAPEMASVEVLQQHVLEVFLDLRLFIKAEVSDYENHKLPNHRNTTMYDLYKKLYGGKKTLWDIAFNTEVETVVDKPCYEDGEERDGSIYASKPGAICISLFRLSQNTSVERARAQVVALMTHEYAHLLGIGEDEAIEYQKIVYKHLMKFDWNSSRDYLQFNKFRAEFLADQLREKARQFENNNVDLDLPEKGKWIDIYSRASDLSKEFNNVSPSVSGIKQMVAVHNSQEGDRSFWQQMRLENIKYYVDQELGLDKKSRCVSYESLFEGSKSVRLADFIKGNVQSCYNPIVESYYHKVDVARPNTYANKPIVRITNNKEMAQELNELAEYWEEEAQLVARLLRSAP